MTSSLSLSSIVILLIMIALLLAASLPAEQMQNSLSSAAIEASAPWASWDELEQRILEESLTFTPFVIPGYGEVLEGDGHYYEKHPEAQAILDILTTLASGGFGQYDCNDYDKDIVFVRYGKGFGLAVIGRTSHLLITVFAASQEYLVGLKDDGCKNHLQLGHP